MGMSFPALGEQFVAGSSGQNGLAVSSKCYGGMSGPFCAPCQAGTFKYDFSFAECQRCSNKPHENAYYTGLGAATSNCPYECAKGLDPSDLNLRCENAL